ncbi:biofilm development regulator YmgB/AriR family protein [Winslowiella iniecta]|uniref:Uncharacterized protein n=1 Tax=Winslowiella iniecta TaxID=1560201 RepID=A0A0L7T868_9GAMM|nr:biofilm development regulator YmgB/AriR family protein [Winslowiella iniecta]KOC91577.1 hypothetical protein NG42_04875 [Winslowiella iniecta]KOC94471.1 hypothetical protein NG43_04625 [Winslowiella iniecta]
MSTQLTTDEELRLHLNNSQLTQSTPGSTADILQAVNQQLIAPSSNAVRKNLLAVIVERLETESDAAEQQVLREALSMLMNAGSE